MSGASGRVLGRAEYLGGALVAGLGLLGLAPNTAAAETVDPPEYASDGCPRLTTERAEWVYDTIPIGTNVPIAY